MNHELTQREILDIATCMGYYILKNGGETSRAEDTVERIGLAYGMDSVHVFAIGNLIIVSMEKDDVSLSQTRRVKGGTTNLHQVEKFNSLSRKICETLPSYKEIVHEIRSIKNIKPYPYWVLVLAYALVAGGFTVFFGGGAVECVVSFVIGALLKPVMTIFDKLKAAAFFANVAGAAFTVSLTQAANIMLSGMNSELVNIGVLMNLVPGVLLTNCIRDFVATDYVSGTAKIVETLLIAAAIALGVSVSLLWR
ncbi:MAG: threonine/serine exporter family protein [Clostridia bacterium]|nr:threonine/serine exporter family protein [Clostridia bacterium]